MRSVVVVIHPRSRQRLERLAVQFLDRQNRGSSRLERLIFIRVAGGYKITGDPAMRNHHERR